MKVGVSQESPEIYKNQKQREIGWLLRGGCGGDLGIREGGEGEENVLEVLLELQHQLSTVYNPIQ